MWNNISSGMNMKHFFSSFKLKKQASLEPFKRAVRDNILKEQLGALHFPM